MTSERNSVPDKSQPLLLFLPSHILWALVPQSNAEKASSGHASQDRTQRLTAAERTTNEWKANLSSSGVNHVQNSHLCIFEAEEEGVFAGSCELHAGHGHDVAKERKGRHLLQLLLTGFGICKRCVKLWRIHSCDVCITADIPDDLSDDEVLWKDKRYDTNSKNPIQIACVKRFQLFCTSTSWMIL